MPVLGVPKFNAITILDIDAINFASVNVHLVAHAAFVSTEDGNTYGEHTCTRWSANTIEKLKELRAAMEMDVAAQVFQANSANVLTGGPAVHETSDGISEHAGIATETEQA